jgi:hypothetical protein
VLSPGSPTGSPKIGGFLVGGKYGTSSAQERADHILTLVRTVFPCEAHPTMELPGKGIGGRGMTEDGQQGTRTASGHPFANSLAPLTSCVS